MFVTIKVVSAYLLDLLIGDPRWLPHPVIAMGKLISWLDRVIRPVFLRLTASGHDPRLIGRILGLIFPLVVVLLAFALPFVLLRLISWWNGWLASLVEIVLIATTIATKGLADAGKAVYQALQAGDMAAARQQLSQIVGRDTADLDEREITRGTVETVAENIVDAVTSPLLFALIGGAPLAMAYRAVNTLDSMVGYKNEQYLHLGWASARLDDLCNWLPARLTFLAVVVASGMLRFHPRAAWQMGLRDAHKHPSPNSGWTESAVAGALNIQLGGTNYYQGVASHRALMGDPVETLCARHIAETIQIHYVTTIFFLAVLGVIRLFIPL